MSPVSVRRLHSGDETILEYLAQHNADFELEAQGSSESFDQSSAAKYLSNPLVLVWIAEAESQVVGSLHCYHLPLPSSDGHELLLYEIGVHHEWRRHSVGRALMDTMAHWMTEHNVPEVWVLADNPGAVEFYKACGSSIEENQPTYMTRRAEPESPPSP